MRDEEEWGENVGGGRSAQVKIWRRERKVGSAGQVEARK
jgi:hypothetical protein